MIAYIEIKEITTYFEKYSAKFLSYTMISRNVLRFTAGQEGPLLNSCTALKWSFF